MNDDHLLETVHRLVEDIEAEMLAEEIAAEDVLPLDEYVDPDDIIMVDDYINSEELEPQENIPFDLVLPKVNPLLSFE